MNREQIAEFYNSNKWIEGKVREFLKGNKRIDYCINFFSDSIPATTKNVLEIGCSIGLTTYYLGNKYENIHFVGTDISQDQILLAKKYLRRSNIEYIHSDITEDTNIGDRKFDCITLFDVYEHIPEDGRSEFNRSLSKLLAKNGIILITCPSWIISKDYLENHPERRQIIDETVDLIAYAELAKSVSGHLVFLELKSIWQKFDYCHCIISKEKPLEPVVPTTSTSFFRKIIIKLGLNKKIVKDPVKIKLANNLNISIDENHQGQVS